MEKKLLIVEEALRDLKAHWFEYIKTIKQAATGQGWQVEVAANKGAAPQITDAFTCFPLFGRARYLNQQTDKLPGERYYGFILHSVRCVKVLWPFLKQHSYDAVFVPTVLVHHLLAWYVLMRLHPNKPPHLTLFFVTPPGLWDKHRNQTSFPKSTVVLRKLLRLFARFVADGKITLAVETGEARHQFELLSGLPFTLMPHPVPFEGSAHGSMPSYQASVKEIKTTGKPVLFGCYGFARHEKGSDLLKTAMEQVLADDRFKERFMVQWTDPFPMPDGSICSPGPMLENHAQVTIIDRPVGSFEYKELLEQTGCMILPYRTSSYHARVSRIAIEAACNGIPIIYTKGGWLQENAENFGAGIGIADESVKELVQAIWSVSDRFEEFCAAAKRSMYNARDYYAPEHFTSLLLNPVQSKTTSGRLLQQTVL